MIRFYASRDELVHEDMIIDFLRRQPHGQEWVDVDTLIREEVIPRGFRDAYVKALDSLLAAGRIRTTTSP